MEHTPFAGLTALDENDPITVDGGSFMVRNPRVEDRLLRIGAVTHRHDAHAGLSNPHVSMTGFVSSGGQLSASTTFAVTYTVGDEAGGETTAPAPLVLTTGQPFPAPTITPSAGVISSAGILPAGNYFYAQTYTDGEGGETVIGPATLVTVPPNVPSASVLLVGLASELAPAGQASQYRLWRSYEGEDWHLVTQSAQDSFYDSGFDPPDNPAQPPDQNTTAERFSLVVTLPTVAEEPAIGSGSVINVYLASDTEFTNPCFYQSFPVASGGTTFVIRSDVVFQGEPPPVSTSLRGANQIDPDTDMLWALKSPVASEGDLPASGSKGDVRLVEDSDTLWGFTASGWVNVGGGGTWQPPVANASALPIDPANHPGDARVTLSTMQIWLWEPGAGLEQSFIPAALAAPSAITAGDTGVTCLTSDDNYLYWTWSTGPAHGEWGAIGRSRLDGTQVNPFFVFMGSASGIVNPAGIAVDSSHIYWVHSGAGTIGRANIDGSSPTLNFCPGGATFGVAVDNNYLYFATAAETVGPLTYDGIYRANKADGSNTTKLHTLSDFNFIPRDLKVDSQHIYWSDLTGANIGRCALDGSSAEDSWVSLGPGAVGIDPEQIVLAGEHLYFGRAFPGKPQGAFGAIGRVKLDGTGLEMDYLDIPPGSSGEGVVGLTYSAASFYLSLGGIDYAPSAAQTAAIERYHLGDWVLANTAGGGSAAASGAIGPQGPAGPAGPQGPAGAGAGAGGVTMFVQASGGTVLAPADLEFVASAGPTVNVSSLGGSAGSATVTVPWLGVTIGASGAGGWGSAVASDTFGPGSPSDFVEQGDTMVVNGSLLVDSAPGAGAQIGESWEAAGKFADGYKTRVHFAGLNAGTPNWDMIGVLAGANHTWNPALTFALYRDGFVAWNVHPFNTFTFDDPTATASLPAGSVDVTGTDIWLELWRAGNRAFVAVYKSDPATGASPTFTTSLDISGATYNSLHAGQAGYFGAIGAGWRTNSVGIKSLDILPKQQVLLPFRREVDFVGSGGIGVAVTDSGGGSATVVVGGTHGGLATLTSGSALVSDPNIKAASRVQLTAQDDNTTGALRVSTRTNGASFTIKSSNAGDTGVVAYDIFGT